ncbi:MAG TPA: hypothetical protein VND98_09945 [Solirubrobacterales bacterium]|nr:hypothetical protein [Solirubrobacterales bacterium]
MLVAAVAAAASLALVAAPASANVSHAFSTTFGSKTSNPPDPYPISEPTDVAVDQASHDIYVTDPGNHRVEKFDSSGNFLFMFGKEVNKTAVETAGRSSEANVCPAPGHPSDQCESGVSSESPGGLSTPTYLAIDNFPFGEGDIYVADTADNVVTKFNSSGEVISGWGVAGQKDGSDDPRLPKFGPIFSLAVGGNCASPTAPRTGTCHGNGTLYVGGLRYGYNVREYTQSGQWIVDTFQEGLPWLKVNPLGELFFTETPFSEYFSGHNAIFEIIPKPGTLGEGEQYQVTTDSPTVGFAFDPSNEQLYQATSPYIQEGTELHPARIDHYSSDCEPISNACEPVDWFGEGHLTPAKEVNIERANNPNFLKGVAVDGSTGTVFVVNASSSEPNQNDIAVFRDVRPIVTTEPPTNLTSSSVTLTGHIEPAGRGEITECHFEYGYDKTYGYTVPCSPAIPPNYPSSSPTDVQAVVSGLSPGTHEHYRLVATNTSGATAYGGDETFTTTAPPAIDGLLSENVTATSAELIAQVNPNGLPTRYSFEYGSSSAFGQKVSGTIAAGNADQEIKIQLTELIPHVVYHFRLVAENKVEGQEEGGTTTSEEQTFNFYPPSCPNENVRQQTKTNFLPDCRAYELVSPGDANGTQLYSGGPNTGQATAPSRLAFTGLFSIIPGSGGSPIDGSGDLYVATRTDTGWLTRYVGLPANQAAIDGGPEQGLFGQGGAQFLGNSTAQTSTNGPDDIQNNTLTDPGMNKFLDWNDGSQEGHSRNPTPISSNAPYVWSADGRYLDRWPSNLGAVPTGLNPTALEGGVSPGGVHSLDCPDVSSTGGFVGSIVENNCPGEVSASSDLSHFVFSTEWNLFTPGGNLNPPGSVYDNNTAAGTVAVASMTPSGDAIPSEPGDHAGDPLQIPGVSSDGSHVLIGSGAVGPCGLVNCSVPPCGDTFGGKLHCPTYPLHLYMRVDDALTYDVSQGHAVQYVGMTADASKVYFTSPEQLTGEDHDASVDLYMWSEAGEKEGKPLTLISKGNNEGNPGEPGQSDACKASFTTPNQTMTKNCDIVTWSSLSYCQLEGNQGGNCRADSSIASQNGDIYFFSPEQLDGSHGIPNKENLYVFRAATGKVQFVAALEPKDFCIAPSLEGFGSIHCSSTPIARMQVAPDDSHMAFATASQVTQYDNAGHLEMYLYDPSSGRITCASCIPSGAPPVSNIGASQNGLFMTNDGRVFFTTNDALVHADTNEAQDVYEYVDGRPQLITTGTGETRVSVGGFSTLLAPPGLDGVSADGRDVYFSSYDTLSSQDHNGLFLKFYDARAGGGFPAPPPPPPCEAADECHGPGSLPPSAMQNESGANLSGGNANSASHHIGHRRRKRQHRRVRHGRSQRHRAAHRNRRGSR